MISEFWYKSRKSAQVDDRKIVNAIFYVLRTGMRLRNRSFGVQIVQRRDWPKVKCLQNLQTAF